jgi:hypothetical protein
MRVHEKFILFFLVEATKKLEKKMVLKNKHIIVFFSLANSLQNIY